MLSRRSGKIINVAAWTARQGGREMVLYTTAKTALAGFTRAQALEWAPYGIHVNAIAPGLSLRPASRECVARSSARRRPYRCAGQADCEKRDSCPSTSLRVHPTT